MKKRNIKAFTVVELVIVIAVIAVLAAVMIPTFSGIIRQATKAADEAELSAINTNLAIEKITKDVQLYDVIKATYGEEKAANFAPKSAKYGYHYWYDVVENRVRLGTTEDIAKWEAEKTSKTENSSNITVLSAGGSKANEPTFSENHENSFQMMRPGYYLLDMGGSVVGDFIKAVRDSETVDKADSAAIDKAKNNITKKMGALKDPVKNGDLEATRVLIVERLEQHTYYGNNVTVSYDAEKAGMPYFVPGITDLSLNVIREEETHNHSNAENLVEGTETEATIILPDTITSFKENSLQFSNTEKVTVTIITSFTVDTTQKNTDGNDKVVNSQGQDVTLEYNATNVNVSVSYKTESAPITDIQLDLTYNASNTEGKITATDAAGNKIEVEISISFGNKITSFEIAPNVDPSNPNFYLDDEDNILYVAHNAGSFEVNAVNFQATVNAATAIKDVRWNVPENAPFKFEKTGDPKIGRFTITNVPDKFDETFNYAGTITAIAVTDENVTATLNIHVVVMQTATVNVGNNTLAVNNSTRYNTLELTYDGTAATAEYEISGFKCTHNYSYAKCCTNVEPTFTTSGNLFTIEDGKLKLKTGAGDLNGTQTFTVKVGNHIEKTFTVTVIDNSATTFEKVFSNNYLYRVGNSNTITLGQLFKTVKPGKGDISVAIYDAAYGKGTTVDKLTNNYLTATYTNSGLTADTWAASTIKFGGTGVAIIEIKNDAGTQTVIVEVVDGYNITDASQLKSNANNILLNDIKLASGAKFSLAGDANNHKTLYGNGFTFDITEATTKGNGVITLSNADIDNVRIVGKAYETYQEYEGSGQNEYYASVIYVYSGTSRISNSYIFGGRSNIRVNSDLEIINSVVECARLANIHVSNGTLTIDGLTTINEPRTENNNVLGMGITFGNDAMADAKIVIKGELTQYNWLRESDEGYLPNVTGLSTVVDKIFAETKYLHDIGGVKYVNMGIAGLSEQVTADAVVFSNSNNAYEATNISSMGFTGFIISIVDAKYDATTADLNYRTNAYTWTPTAQSNTIPTIKWNQYSGGTADISFERGQSFEFNPNVLTATKHGNTLVPSVTINGVDYTGKKITFTEAQTCTVKYTVKDAYVYDANGNPIAAVTYTYYLVVNVTTTDPAIKAPEFSFNNASGYTEVTIGDKIYINPTPTDTSKFQAITVSGTTIYAPIVELSYKDNTSDFTPYYPIFGNGLTITWYDANGTATTYNSSSNLSAMPTGSAELTWITDITNLKGDKNWEGYKNVSGSGLVRAGSAVGRDVDGSYYANVEFSFRAEGTETYYYYVRYHGSAHTKPSGCVTGDTLVTLADGTHKEIQYVTYEDQLLVWNHFTGKYQVVPAAIIFNHGYGNNTVIKLNFSDGTQVKAINLHQFLDADLNKYVTISADTVADYVGHSFVKQNGEGYKTVTLESYEISEEYIEAYGIISALHYNIFVEGMFSTDFMEQDYDLFNYFTIGEGMVYDAEQMQEDIEKYGLYTYEEFADYLTYEQFVGFNVQYFKIAVGKGNYTYEGILELIDTYLNA